ncbi:acyl-CoA synthetase [Nocardia nova]|uniref:Acyl-CoA synthetase n=1 Tax=Nocardia nova TaxID=37330 RepID=A0A2S6AN63_9NOCA|nr:acyl-CoA synthetase [Nocardia nova]PPJ25715.1 acyl-CoA synthetase [Nocardia nova]PPJ36658.1 acyl-CoA synthetase [Nocardia nova]
MYPGAIAKTTPDKLAAVLYGTDQTLTFAQLEDKSAALARVLHDAGLRRGDVVALLTDNRLEAFEVVWATQRAGLYVTPVNSHLKADEVHYIVKDSGAKALIVSASLGPVTYEVAEMSDDLLLTLAFGGDVPGFSSYENAIEAADEPLEDMPCGGFMLYSSGTTGFPKGIKQPLPDRQLDEPGDWVAPMIQDWYGLDENDVYLSPAPIYHAAPLRYSVAMQALGATVVMTSRFDPQQVLRCIDEHRVTATQMVPTMFVRMLKLPAATRSSFDVSSLRAVIHAAAPCPTEVKRAMIEWVGPILYEYYGASETYGQTLITSQEWLQKPGSVGRSTIGILHICDEDGNELPPERVGTLYFERDTMPFIYHNDPEKTSAAQHPRHPLWTTVGDIGYADADGYLYLTDRKAFTIISGGVNIYPQEIEDTLTMHPAVFDVAVIGVPDPEMGEQVKAVVQLMPDVSPSAELASELIQHTRTHLAKFKAPRSVDFIDDLPRTPTGKLQKRLLKARYADKDSTNAPRPHG